MEMLLVFIYLAIGVILSLYWFKHDYGEEYEEFEEYDVVEKDSHHSLLTFYITETLVRKPESLIFEIK